MPRSHSLTVTWHRGWSIFMIIGFGILTAFSAAMAWTAWPDRLLLLTFAICFTLLMGLGLLRGISMLLHPPVMFRADRDRVETFFFKNSYRKQGYIIPWDDVDSLSLVARTGVGGASSRVKTVTIALHLIPGSTAPIEVSAGGYHDPQTVHLDANSGTLRGEALLKQLQALHK